MHTLRQRLYEETLSTIGIILLSISNQDGGLYLLPYPPFGLPTITFMGISSYMLFVGLYYSAISISLNAELRKSIEKSVEQEFSFVSKIGLYQMEDEIQTRVKTITKRSPKTLEENSGVQVSLESEEMDDYIKLVIKEKAQKITAMMIVFINSKSSTNLHPQVLRSQ